MSIYRPDAYETETFAPAAMDRPFSVGLVAVYMRVRVLLMLIAGVVLLLVAGKLMLTSLELTTQKSQPIFETSVFIGGLAAVLLIVAAMISGLASRMLKGTQGVWHWAMLVLLMDIMLAGGGAFYAHRALEQIASDAESAVTAQAAWHGVVQHADTKPLLNLAGQDAGMLRIQVGVQLTIVGLGFLAMLLLASAQRFFVHPPQWAERRPEYTPLTPSMPGLPSAAPAFAEATTDTAPKSKTKPKPQPKATPQTTTTFAFAGPQEVSDKPWLTSDTGLTPEPVFAFSPRG